MFLHPMEKLACTPCIGVLFPACCLCLCSFQGECCKLMHILLEVILCSYFAEFFKILSFYCFLCAFYAVFFFLLQYSLKLYVEQQVAISVDDDIELHALLKYKNTRKRRNTSIYRTIHRYILHQLEIRLTLKYIGYYITKICKYSHNLVSSLEVCF